MANCIISSGRKEVCLDSIGGLDAFYAIPYTDNAFTILDGEVTALDAGVTAAYKFELRADANTLTSDGTADENTGVLLYAETLTVFLKKQDKETNVQVELLQKGLHYFVVKTRNGEYQLVGSLDGARATATNTVSGGARSDGNGYNLTITANSKIMTPMLDEATVTALLAIVAEDS